MWCDGMRWRTYLQQELPRSHWEAAGSLVSSRQTSRKHRWGWTSPAENRKSFIETKQVSVHFNLLLLHTNIASVSWAKSRAGCVFIWSTVRRCQQFLLAGATEPKNLTGISWFLCEHMWFYIKGADGGSRLHSSKWCWNSLGAHGFAAGL